MRLLKIVPDNTNIDFVRLRYWAFGLTTLLTIAAIALVFVNRLNMGVDFVGGLMIEEKFAAAPNLDQVRSVLLLGGSARRTWWESGYEREGLTLFNCPQPTDDYPEAHENIVRALREAHRLGGA